MRGGGVSDHGATLGGRARGLLALGAGAASLVLLTWLLSERHFYSQLRLSENDVGQEEAAAAQPPVNVVVKQIHQPVENATQKPSWDYNWDKKAWKSPEEAKGVGVRSILLVRHGKYDFNTGKLTDIGRKQANLTGLRLKELNQPYFSITHSTMPRAVETAQLIHAHLPNVQIHEDEMLIEGGPIQPQPTVNYWGLPDRTYFQDGPRLEAAFRKYFYRADKEQTQQSFQILVGHANIFRFFALRALQFPREAWMRVFIAHASISLLHINPDGTITMTKFGDSGHLPPNLVTI